VSACAGTPPTSERTSPARSGPGYWTPWRPHGQLDPERCPFTRSVAEQLRKHEDRGEFVVGIDLIVNGITARQ
jgi:hypothetical protein